MKKLIAFLLVLVLSLSLSITAFADDYYHVGMTEENSTADGDMEVKAHVHSSCTVLIPETITASYFGTTTHVTFCDIDLEDGYQVSVYVTNINENNYFRIPHITREDTFAECLVYCDSRGNYLSSGDTLLAYLDDVPGSGVAEREFTVSLMNGVAGDYCGTMQYEIKVEPIGD